MHYFVCYELNTIDARRSRSISGVIVVDAESFRSTCHGRNAYIHDHAMNNIITMHFSINCPTVICLPTICHAYERDVLLVSCIGISSRRKGEAL